LAAGIRESTLHFVASQVAAILVYTHSEKWSNYVKVLIGCKLRRLIQGWTETPHFNKA